jgi:hypothetical protein
LEPLRAKLVERLLEKVWEPLPVKMMERLLVEEEEQLWGCIGGIQKPKGYADQDIVSLSLVYGYTY